MKLVPLGPGFGVEVQGVSLLDAASSEEAFAAVEAAFEQHSVLLFRGQAVTDAIQIAFSRGFGPLELGKVGSRGAGGFLGQISNIADDGSLLPPDHRSWLVAAANQLWHTDSSFLARPAKASVLSARTVPDRGGETEFCSTRLAWERLTPARQAELRDLVVEHAYFHSRDRIAPDLMTAEQRAAMPAVDWRLTWPNPKNGRRSLYIASHAGAIRGMAPDDATALLDALRAEATAEGRTYRHRWQPGDVVMWDNRATMHRGRPWPADSARKMVRTTIKATEADGLAAVRPPASVANAASAASAAE
ncbi:MAG: TauD/TfdA family dioxygenase [Alphaproteobacteria bacterium]|nr:TauD/TfdA family dioxygenase [Alphaproteobacteria bacterium]MCB9928279.1 TauD/TfdA family dioxygenase [Alphaproteobacteria bacterium]